MKRVPTIFGLAAIAIGGTAVLWLARPEAQDVDPGPAEQKRVTEPCDLAKIDLVGRSILEASDWRAASQRVGALVQGDAVRTSIRLRPERGRDFTKRFGQRISILVDLLDRYGSEWPEIVAWVQVAELCNLSLQPEVTNITVGPLWPH